MKFYIHQNEELIGMVIRFHGIKVEWRDILRFKLDRAGRKMHDDITGIDYEIPSDWDVT